MICVRENPFLGARSWAPLPAVQEKNPRWCYQKGVERFLQDRRGEKFSKKLPTYETYAKARGNNGRTRGESPQHSISTPQEGRKCGGSGRSKEEFLEV